MRGCFEFLKAFNARLKKALGGLCALLMALLCAIVLWGVVTRYIFSHQAAYTEEAARMLLIITTFFGAAYAFALKAHIGLDALKTALSKPAQKLCALFACAAAAAFVTLVMIWGGGLLIDSSRAADNALSSMPVKMWQVYLCVPLSGIASLCFVLEEVLQTLLAKDERGSE